MQTSSIMFTRCLSCCLGGEAVQMEGSRRVHLGPLNIYSSYLNAHYDVRCVCFTASSPDETDTVGTDADF